VPDSFLLKLRSFQMSKKISLLLILFMVGSWCVFADDGGDEGLAPGVVILIAVGVVLLIGGTVAIALAASGDKEGAQKVMDSLSMEEQGNGKTSTIKTIMDNPLVKHSAVDVTKDNKTFVGVRFAW
jgi:hypothetical protein